MTVGLAIIVGLAIFVGTIAIVRMIANGPPPEPDPDLVHEVEVDYRCSICGMRLTVTQQQDQKFFDLFSIIVGSLVVFSFTLFLVARVTALTGRDVDERSPGTHRADGRDSG